MDHNEFADGMVETHLSILPEQHITEETYHHYAAHNKKSPKLKPNQISIYGITIKNRQDHHLEATALVRNTVRKNIHFKQVMIALLDANDQLVAKHVFDLTLLGSIPSNAARPWTFVFPPESIFTQEWVDEINWSLAFEKKTEHHLDMEGEFSSEKGKKKIQEVIAKAHPLKPDEVNFMGLSVKKNKSGLTTVMLLRNGTNKDVTFKQIPLEVIDASEDVIASGTFKLDGLTVKANTSKPATFSFPCTAITKEHIDLSTWKIKTRAEAK